MKKSILLVAVLIALVSLCLVFAGCDSGSSDSSDPVTYTVSFNANGGSGTMNPSEPLEAGTIYKIPANGFTEPAGTLRSFAGWNTAADGSGTAYAAGATIESVTANITLYAQWTKPSFTVGKGDDDTAGTDDDEKVYFAKGNLQYQASSDTWKFAANQYDFIGNAAGNNTADEATRKTQSDWIDLFGWGTTGYPDTRTSSNDYQTNYQPYSSSNAGVASTAPAYKINRYGYGPDYDDTNKYGLSVDSKSDWGGIESLPGNSSTTKVWRTLSKDEWEYLIKTRTMTNGKDRYSNAVSGVSIGGTTYKGVFIYPDNYNGDVVSDSMTWEQINAAGIVFLPAAGLRSGSSVDRVGDDGNYWSATAYDDGRAYYLNFSSSNATMSNGLRCSGRSVRLVCGEN